MAHPDDPLPSALDVADLVLQQLGPTEPLKLQKLVYYCQAWSLAWHGRPLFSERIQAWVHGPVVPELYQMTSGRASVVAVGGSAEALSSPARTTVLEVLDYYGKHSPAKLRRLTHDEAPWRDARGGIPDNCPSTNEITRESMRRFYRDRPCGGGKPMRDFSCFSAERVRRSLEEIAGDDTIDLESL
ncbi:MAG TPA: type II toxin-antitoxin system antitoxin SocA domain-containing protein [Planctomycetota bacterium]|nr:type II toxin-antitoxin system antitoxin SocA domain-containing protein [Planctomycetota bacterium]